MARITDADRAEYARLTAKIQTLPGKFAGALPAPERREWYRLRDQLGERPERTTALRGLV